MAKRSPESDIRSGIRFIVIAGIAVLVLSILSWLVGFYTDWLWFDQLGYGGVLIKTFWAVWSLRIVFTLLIGTFFFINLYLVRGALLFLRDDPQEEGKIRFLPFRVSLPWLVLLGLLLGFFFSGLPANRWFVVQQFLHSTEFGVVDPILGKDVGFYLFRYPLYRFLNELLLTLTFITTIGVGVVYFLVRTVSMASGRIVIQPRAKYHISALTALLFFLKAWDYLLQTYGLMYSPRGVVFGAGFTDIHANLPGLRILMIISLICGVLALANITFRGMKLFFASVGLLLVTSLVLGIVYPTIVQRLQVEPNEFVRETPYIEHNIAYTNKAFGLDRISEQNFAVHDNLTADSIEANRDTIDNIRLWDWRPIRQTYNQLQGIRFYYRFHDVDIDRYVIDGEQRQVMIGARELDATQLPADTWINLHLVYTHGYGISMSPTNAVTEEGLPEFFIRDIPPRSSIDLQIDRPEIYFGELTNQYVIVNTKAEEFDYPAGQTNVYTSHEGHGGVQLDSFVKRLAFSLRLGSYRLLVSDLITPDSRVMMIRNIQERTQRIAPYLMYDSDPYIVAADGRLFWIQDAYTVSNYYPYSEPYNNSYNYIRNAVKVVTDAYNGDVSFYIADPEDPVIQTYSKIFPDLYQTMDDMPDYLRPHIRYPLDMFTVQARMFGVYHMKDPAVFYNREDVWNIGQEIYRGASQEMVPYYSIMRLPGMDEPEFILMIPYTPAQRPNMIAWLAARSDGEHYGELKGLRFSNQELIYGPMQVESRIDQDAYISQQLTLWGQRGSSVIRGNLLVIPINDSLLYVEPLYIQSEQNELPQLRRVIVAYGPRIVMAPTLEDALEQMFMGTGAPLRDDDEPIDGVPGVPADLINQAAQLYRQANQASQAGDWAGYGEAIRRLGDVLEQLQQAEN